MDHNTIPLTDAARGKNVSSSIAGAGSGEFHVYREQRRTEMKRLRELHLAETKRRENVECRQALQTRQEKEQLKTIRKAARRRSKRERARQRMSSGTEGIPREKEMLEAAADSSSCDKADGKSVTGDPTGL